MTTQREFITKIIECFPLSDDGTGHIVDCGYDHETTRCGCAELPGKIADLLTAHDREVAAKALREAAANDNTTEWGRAFRMGDGSLYVDDEDGSFGSREDVEPFVRPQHSESPYDLIVSRHVTQWEVCHDVR